MFTGIIENVGIIKDITENGSNSTFWIEVPFATELKTDQSLSHNGVCLTVEETKPPLYRVTAIAETLRSSNLGKLAKGNEVNLERSMQPGGRLDGHLVQGHIEALSECLSVQEKNGSWEYRFRFPAQYAALVVEKGSICLNGISLTLFDVTDDQFTVAIIPYTYHHTNIRQVKAGSLCNTEFDIIGKYVQRHLQTRNS